MSFFDIEPEPIEQLLTAIFDTERVPSLWEEIIANMKPIPKAPTIRCHPRYYGKLLEIMTPKNAIENSMVMSGMIDIEVVEELTVDWIMDTEDEMWFGNAGKTYKFKKPTMEDLLEIKPKFIMTPPLVGHY